MEQKTASLSGKSNLLARADRSDRSEGRYDAPRSRLCYLIATLASHLLGMLATLSIILKRKFPPTGLLPLAESLI